MNKTRTHRRRAVPLPVLFRDTGGCSHARRLQRHFSFQLALRYGACSPGLLRSALDEVDGVDVA